MREFDYSKLADKDWCIPVLYRVSKIKEYRDMPYLFVRKTDVEIYHWTLIANIRNIAHSNKLDGVDTSEIRYRLLISDRTIPRNRSEEEILGYRNIMDDIKKHHDYLPITPETILAIHKKLFEYTRFPIAGKFRSMPDDYNLGPEPQEQSVLPPHLPKEEVPKAIEQMCKSYNECINNNIIDDLLIIPIFLLDFLCVAPFDIGNGRMCRILMQLLLWRGKYFIGQYVSLERKFHYSIERYLDSLEISSYGWHENENDPELFVLYFLEWIRYIYEQFDNHFTIRPKRLKSLDLSKKYYIPKPCSPEYRWTSRF